MRNYHVQPRQKKQNDDDQGSENETALQHKNRLKKMLPASCFSGMKFPSMVIIKGIFSICLMFVKRGGGLVAGFSDFTGDAVSGSGFQP